MDAGGEVLAGILDPFHRATETDRQKANGHFLREEMGLDPEAAANVGRDDADVVLRKAKDVGNTRAQQVRDLSSSSGVYAHGLLPRDKCKSSSR